MESSSAPEYRPRFMHEFQAPADARAKYAAPTQPDDPDHPLKPAPKRLNASPASMDLSRADLVNASLGGTLRTLAFLVIGVLLFSAVAWEVSTISGCVSSGTFEVQKAINTTLNECDNPSFSRDYRERAMRTQQCELARDIKDRGTFTIVLECIFSHHFGAIGACRASPVCTSFVAWSDTFRERFTLILITVCIFSLFGLKFMFQYERDGLEMLRGAVRGFWATRAIDAGIPAPASDKKVV